MTTTASDQSPPAPPPSGAQPQVRSRRGREGAADMVRSLGLVLLLVVPIWFLAQPGRDAEQGVRVVDSTGDVQAWSSAVPGAPAPTTSPSGWRPTVSQFQPTGIGLRLGWNTASGRYAEFAGSTAPAQAFVEELAGTGTSDGTVDVDGVPWTRYTDDDGSISLVRQVGDVVVVVGTLRSTAPLEELVVLAGTVEPAGR